MSKLNGIVMESGRGWVLVLLENGEYRRFRTRSFLMPGDAYQGRSDSSYPRYLAAAAAVIIMLLGMVDFFNVLAYAQVSSGVELGINRWNRVISVSAINTSGESILQTVEPKGQKLEKALEMVLEESLKQDDDSAPQEILVSIKIADNDKSLPPGIDKKLEKLNALEGNNEYDLKMQASEQDKIVYGLSKKNGQTHPSEGINKPDNQGASSNSGNKNDNRKSGINTDSNNNKNDNKIPMINPNSNNKNDSPKPVIDTNSSDDKDNEQ